MRLCCCRDTAAAHVVLAVAFVVIWLQIIAGLKTTLMDQQDPEQEAGLRQLARIIQHKVFMFQSHSEASTVFLTCIIKAKTMLDRCGINLNILEKVYYLSSKIFKYCLTTVFFFSMHVFSIKSIMIQLLNISSRIKCTRKGTCAVRGNLSRCEWRHSAPCALLSHSLSTGLRSQWRLQVFSPSTPHPVET